MSVVHVPEPGHHCGPNRFGYWLEHGWERAGTVRRCDECDRTWVALGPATDMGVMLNRWRPEGRIERWRRDRRDRRALRGGEPGE